VGVIWGGIGGEMVGLWLLRVRPDMLRREKACQGAAAPREIAFSPRRIFDRRDAAMRGGGVLTLFVKTRFLLQNSQMAGHRFCSVALSGIRVSALRQITSSVSVFPKTWCASAAARGIYSAGKLQNSRCVGLSIVAVVGARMNSVSCGERAASTRAAMWSGSALRARASNSFR